MTLDMFVAFTLMAFFGAVCMGLMDGSVPKGIMYAILFLGFLWGIGIGTKVTDNELLWFFVFAPATTAVLFGLVHLIFPKFFPALGKAFLKEVDKRK
jgi:hypothetical protein